MPIRGCCKVASKSEKYPNRFGNHDRNEIAKAIDEKRLDAVSVLSVPSSAALKRRKFAPKLKPGKEETSDEVRSKCRISKLHSFLNHASLLIPLRGCQSFSSLSFLQIGTHLHDGFNCSQNVACSGRDSSEGRVRKAKVFFGDLQSEATLTRSRRGRVRCPSKKLSNEAGLHANDRKLVTDEMCNVNEYEVLSSFFLITTQNVSPMMRTERSFLGNDADKRKCSQDNEIHVKNEFPKNSGKDSLAELETDLASESEAIMALATLREEG